jgi:hypothetical protein
MTTTVIMTPDIREKLKEHALGLQHARRSAGDPSYGQLQRKTGYSKASISRLLNAHTFPKWEFVEAFLKACGIDDPQISSHYRLCWLEIAELRRPLGAESWHDDHQHPGPGIAQECAECGALVSNPLRHQAWHASQSRRESASAARTRGTGGTVHQLSS